MGPASLEPHWLFIASEIPLVLSILLLKLGIWPKRRGDTPHCRKCGYNLTALASERCPECGADLSGSKAIVRGERRRRPIVTVLAISMLGLAGALWVQTARQVNWYHWRPTAWVFNDLNSTSPAAVRKAWWELVRRSDAGKLSRQDELKLLDLCLDEQAAQKLTGVTDAPMRYLGQRYLNGKLSPKQEKRFLEQIARFELQVRPKVVSGDPIPVKVVETYRCPGSSMLKVDASPVVLACGDTEFHLDLQGTSVSVLTGGSFGGYAVTGNSSQRLLRCDLAPGRHVVTAAVPLKIYDGRYTKREDKHLRYKRDIRLERSFEVLPAKPEGYVKLIKDPETDREVREAVTPDRIIRTVGADKSDLLDIELAVTGLPVDCAFEVLVRIGGSELNVGSLSLRKGQTLRFRIPHEGTLPAGDVCDVIIKSSQDEARRTVDIFEIWDGELVYEDVPVADEKPD
ncbi:MAG: hypothetical protein JXQ73_05365 [Phycisphaerae bacterium]|nr:hypothetical protein [Phycisphaerae bacterium]